MRIRRKHCLLALPALMLSLLPVGAKPDERVGIGKMEDIEGTVHDPAKSQKTVAIVFVYVDVTCPIANFYQPALRRMAEAYEPKGIRFYQIHPDPYGDKKDLATHAREFDVVSPVILDSKQALAKKHDAKVTPEVHIYRADGRRLYRGRIDNTYATYGKRRPEATSHELKEALEAVLAGRKPARDVTKAVGCQILIER